MLNIDLIPKEKIMVFASINPVSVTRVGDICLTDDLSARSPWEYLFSANHYAILTGTANKHTKMDINIISLSSIFYKIDQLYNYSKQQFTLALIQENLTNKYQAAINSACRLSGSKIIGNEITIDFSVDKCEMIYD